jgi:hypothetical protein
VLTAPPVVCTPLLTVSLALLAPPPMLSFTDSSAPLPSADRFALARPRVAALRPRLEDARLCDCVRRLVAALDREPPVDFRELLLGFAVLFERDLSWAILTPFLQIDSSRLLPHAAERNRAVPRQRTGWYPLCSFVEVGYCATCRVVTTPKECAQGKRNCGVATTKSTSRSGQRRSGSSNGSAARSKPKASGSRSSGGTTRSQRGSSRSSAATPESKARSRTQASRSPDGAVGTLKEAAGKAKGPALAVGAAAAGVAGGVMLKSRYSRKRVLGLPLPRTIGRPSLTNVDLPSIAKTLGKASKQFGQTSKNVSKDIERVGDQAERIGKILD